LFTEIFEAFSTKIFLYLLSSSIAFLINTELSIKYLGSISAIFFAAITAISLYILSSSIAFLINTELSIKYIELFFAMFFAKAITISSSSLYFSISFISISQFSFSISSQKSLSHLAGIKRISLFMYSTSFFTSISHNTSSVISGKLVFFRSILLQNFPSVLSTNSISSLIRSTSKYHTLPFTSLLFIIYSS
jgi:hypothetical protein